ncbi:MAG: tRNA dimethylallyltransferase [Patescibacteria group bacterium]|nr:tRNA dimethylallyltransferase [Patescibacteria group bacterium]
MSNEDNKKDKPKIVVILGPTASGKTSLGVRLAYDFGGEIISADSRQVYKGMDIGTGKDLPDYNYQGKKIPYHLLDVASPRTNFSVARYQRMAKKVISDVIKRGKLPIIVGGSGLYLQAVIDNYKLSDYKSDKKYRTHLEKLGAEKIYLRIKELNLEFAKRITLSDQSNARRLSRYLELIEKGRDLIMKKDEPIADFLILGKKITDEKMKINIKKRLEQRLDEQGMIEEVRGLKDSGLSYKRLISFGLEYKYIAYYLQGKIDEEKLRTDLVTAIYRFAKKQKTWFKRWEKQGQKIDWIDNYQAAAIIVKKFLKERKKTK